MVCCNWMLDSGWEKRKKKMDIFSLAFGGNPDADTLVIVRCIRLIIGNLCRKQEFGPNGITFPWKRWGGPGGQGHGFNLVWVYGVHPIIEERIKCGSVFSNEIFWVHHKETGLNPDIWIKNVGLAFLFIYRYLIESM